MNIRTLSFIRSHYPEAFGIRKFLQRKKVQRIYRHMLPQDDILKCEHDASQQQAVIAPYLEKWANYLSYTRQEIDRILSNPLIFNDKGLDAETIRTDMLFCRLAYGFIPSEYISFNLIHKSPGERRAFCSDLDMRRFCYTVNHIADMHRIFDKAISAKRFGRYYHRDLLILHSGTKYEAFEAFVKKHPVFIRKEVFSAMGRGIMLIDTTKDNPDLRAVFDKWKSEGKSLLEERIIQSRQMSLPHPSSVNTIRCITLNTSSGIIVPYCFMRAGQNGRFVDNGGSGGLLMGIDIEKGIVNTDGYDEHGHIFVQHPNTGVTLKGFTIPQWEEMLRICKTAAADEPRMGYLAWDMAHTDTGWKVVEVNEAGQFIGPQTVYQSGIKAELESYMARMPSML